MYSKFFFKLKLFERKLDVCSFESNQYKILCESCLSFLTWFSHFERLKKFIKIACIHLISKKEKIKLFILVFQKCLIGFL